MITDTDVDKLRQQMIRELADYPTLVTDDILAAVDAVPRHLFLPDTALPKAYSLGSVVTHRDAGGVALSSSTGLTVMAGMLKQLDVRPGHRVLEIGAGTGYNAALLRHMVGDGGSVTTIDILPQAAAEAREHLAAAGFGDVTVVHGDGELGVTDHAPYDRIIVTAGASDLPSAWADQLAPGGLLVVPLRINGLTRAVTFERADGFWRSLEADECGFMPMRGPGQTAEHNLPLRGETGVIVRTDGGEPLDAARLDGVLDSAASVRWTGAVSGDFENLDFWLAAVPGFARVIVMTAGVASGLVRPMYDWGSMGAVADDTLAYLTMRPLGADGGPPYEVGACAYGPGAAGLLDEVTARITAWDREMNGTGDRLWIEVHPVGAGHVPTGMVRVPRRYNQIIVGRHRTDEHTG